MSVREQLEALDALVGKSPAGHRVAFHRWWDIVNADWEYSEDELPQGVPTQFGRVGFLAMATDALNRNDEPRFREICMRALYWEQLRMKEEW